MSSYRLPGSLCQYSTALFVEDGTLCRLPSPLPGPLNTLLNSARDYARRCGNVRTAFALGLEKYAFSETVAVLGEDAAMLIESIWPGLVQALEIYAAGIGVGAVVGGIVGGVLGEGIGAVPGAALGAELGADVATALLFFLGIKFLAEYVLGHLGDAQKHFSKGCTLAWKATGSTPPLDDAAREFGRAIATLFSLIIEAAVVYVASKGLKAGLEKLRESQTGRALVPYVKIQYWREKLGVTNAPVPRRGIGTTIEFFERQTQQGKLKPISEADQLSYMKAMDFSKEVKVDTLKAGEEVIGYRDPRGGREFGYFYTKAGTSVERVGVDFKTAKPVERGSPGKPPSFDEPLLEREFFRYRVRKDVEVLRSNSSGVRAWDTDKPVGGGAVQYFMPESWNVLEIINK